jgi:uncharacterized membrane protein YqgA involved in biofilm formation
MIGVLINALGIVFGGIFGLTRKTPMTAANESFFKVAMGVATIWIGLQLTWTNFNGSFGSVLKQLLIVLISMSLGKVIGRLLRLQKMSNAIGKFAGQKITDAQSTVKNPNDGFLVATLLSCVSPLAFFAGIHEGLTGFSAAFVVKAFMDGLAAFSFVRIFGWNVILSAIPVFALQWLIVIVVQNFRPFLEQHDLVHSILATDGLLIFCVALIILNLKKIELTDYLPSLAVAPLITYLWH